MINWNYVKTLIVAVIIFFIAGLLIGKYKFATHEIKVITETVTETKYKTKIEYVNNTPVFDQSNFNRLLACYESPLKFKDKTENNYLFVTAFDDCKEATARYEIGTKGNLKFYLTLTGIGAAAGAGIVLYYKHKN
jgi:hypothetical protein